MGDRLSSRKKENRAEQLTCDHIDVPFPAIGERPPRNITMHFDIAKARTNGAYSVWVEMSAANIEYLLHYVQHLMRTECEDDDADDHESEMSDAPEEHDVDADDVPPAVAPIQEVTSAPLVVSDESSAGASAPSEPVARGAQLKIWQAFNRIRK